MRSLSKGITPASLDRGLAERLDRLQAERLDRLLKGVEELLAVPALVTRMEGLAANLERLQPDALVARLEGLATSLEGKWSDSGTLQQAPQRLLVPGEAARRTMPNLSVDTAMENNVKEEKDKVAVPLSPTSEKLRAKVATPFREAMQDAMGEAVSRPGIASSMALADAAGITGDGPRQESPMDRMAAKFELIPDGGLFSKYARDREGIVSQIHSVGWEPATEASKRRTVVEDDKEVDPVILIGTSKAFKFFSIFIVLASVGLVGLEANTTASYAIAAGLCAEGHGPPPTAISLGIFNKLEWCVIFWMVLELWVNVKVTMKCRYGYGFGWNVFDFGILAISVLEMIASSFLSEAMAALRINRLVKLFRLLRLAKVFKTLRLVRVLHGVRMMILSMMGSIGTLFWAMFLMFFIIYLVSVLMVQGIEIHFDTMFEEQKKTASLLHCAADAASTWDGTPGYNSELPMFSVDWESDSPTQQVNKLYGSVGMAMLTLFSSISGGSEWALVADPLARISWIFTFLWMIFISTMVFGVINILTGIFCNAAMQAAANDRVAVITREKDERSDAEKILKEAFVKIDEDHSGMLTKDEFFHLLDDDEVKAMMLNLGLDTSEANSLFIFLDDDMSGQVSFTEFLEGCMSLKGMAKKLDIVTLMYQNKRLAQTTTLVMQMMETLHQDLKATYFK